MDGSGRKGRQVLRRYIGIGETAIAVKHPVLDDQRHLVRSRRQLALPDESKFTSIAQDVPAGQPGIDVEPGDAERVVVVPEQGGVPLVRVGQRRLSVTGGL